MWSYLCSFVSGTLFGLIELCREHNRMKGDSIRNFWGIIYVLGMGLTASILFLVVGSRIINLLGLDSNLGIGNVVLSVIIGPLSPLVLKKIGGKGESGEFVTYHEKFFSFMRIEIKHATRIRRLDLAHKLAEHWKDNIEELVRKSVEYVKYVETDEGKKKEGMEYIQSCGADRSPVEIAIFLIESYGIGWVKKNLLPKKRSIRSSL